MDKDSPSSVLKSPARTYSGQQENPLLIIERLQDELRQLQIEHAKLQSDYFSTIKRLALACEYHDKLIEMHLARLSSYCGLIAEKCGLSKTEIEEVELAAPLHDIGKIGVSENILMKPGRLTDHEFSQVKFHTVIGGNILSRQESRLLKRAREIALYHHENWDGSGYPIGLKNSAIPLGARIVSLMDTFDALTSQRPHKMPYPVEFACDVMHQQKESKFDPDMVEMLDDNLDTIIKLKAGIDSPLNIPAYNFALSERDAN